MLSQQEEDHHRQSSANRLMSPRVTPLTNDHVHIQHRNFNDNAACGEQVRQSSDASSSDDVGSGIYGRINHENNSNSAYAPLRLVNAHVHLSRQLDLVASGRADGKGDCAANDRFCGKCKVTGHEKRTWDAGGCAQQRRAQEQLANSQQSKNGDATYGWRNAANPSRQDFQTYGRGYEHNNYIQQSSNHESYHTHDYLPPREVDYPTDDFKAVPKRLIRNDGKVSTLLGVVATLADCR